MGGTSGFYVRGGPDLIELLRPVIGTWRDVAFEPHCRFLHITNDDEMPDELMDQLSREVGSDVLWLSYQSTVGWFEYTHYFEGEIVRELVYNSVDGQWAIVEGEPESWEIFDPTPQKGAFEPGPDWKDVLAIEQHFLLPGGHVPPPKPPRKKAAKKKAAKKKAAKKKAAKKKAAKKKAAKKKATKKKAARA